RTRATAAPHVVVTIARRLVRARRRRQPYYPLPPGGARTRARPHPAPLPGGEGEARPHPDPLPGEEGVRERLRRIRYKTTGFRRIRNRGFTACYPGCNALS